MSKKPTPVRAESAKKPATQKAAPSGQSPKTPPEESFADRVAEARKGLAAVRALLPELHRLDAADRQTSIGRLRDGEDAIIEEILDLVDESPATFQSLAARDHGVDDAVVETGPSREDLAQRAALKPLAEEVHLLAEDMNDTLLDLGARPRTLSIAAYAIAQANSPHDPKIKSGLARPGRFYASHGRPKKKTPEEPPKA